MVDILTPVDPNERFRSRRAQARRRQVRRRRAVALLVLAAIGLAIASAVLVGGGGSTNHPAAAKRAWKGRTIVYGAKPLPTPPREIRGVHVTMALASVKGKIDEYIALRRGGLNTLEVDVKDENGEIGFVPSSVPLAIKVHAAKPYYKPRELAAKVHRAGLYLVGRVVSFEDPIASVNHPSMAIRTADGSLWKNNGGLGWLNPYSREAWRYDVDIAEAAVRAGFDEIQFDYVRFPSDGDVSLIRYPGTHPQGMGWTIPAFVQYAAGRLHPLGARVSVAMFGLAATHDLGIGQNPARIARYVDAIYPMVYPSHYHSGEYNLTDPNAVPGTTVSYSLRDFREATAGQKAVLVPWLQDFTLGRTYYLGDVKAQIEAARAVGTRGFMLWNAGGVYTAQALAGR